MPHPALTGPPVDAVAAAVERLAALDEALPDGDGIHSFNAMYRSVTETVQARLHEGFFDDPAWTERLDVVFANLYLAAVRAASSPPSRVAHCWRPLFARRHDARVLPIQFALAGMNAHINHDLAVAVVRTCEDLDTEPGAGGHRRDYDRVNELLAASEHQVRHRFLDDLPGVDVHAAEAVVGSWSITRARDAAWVNALTLWELRPIDWLRRSYLDALDRTVGFAGHGLLVPLR